MATKNKTILDEIRDYLERFIVFTSEEQALIVSLWILHTWTFMESFPRMPWVTPYLYIYSETPGAGKSTVLRVLKGLVFNPELAGDMTSAAMFTLIEESRPTLLIDEVDTVFNGTGGGNESLRRTMNTGYEASGTAIRKVGKTAEKFSTFSAKILAGIKDLNSDLPETVKTRSIPLKLVKGHPRERFLAFRHGPDAEAISERIDAWIRQNGEAIIDYDPELIESMDPRAFEISYPLLQIARVLGVEVEARTALIRMLAPPLPKDRPEIAMLRQIREAFDEAGAEKLHTASILAKLGDSWNGHLLKNRLKGYVEGDTATIRINGKAGKGYFRHQFEDAWSRFL